MMRSCILLVFLCFGSAVQGSDTLQLSAIIPLTDVKGRFDHFAIDAGGRRLFVAALGNNSLEIIDLAGNQRLSSIPGLRKPTGAAFLPGNRIGVAAGGDGAFKVFDGISRSFIGSIEPLEDADNVRFQTNSNTIYVGYGEGALALIDPKTLKRIGDFQITGHPESFQLEQLGRRIFINVPGNKELSILDSQNGRVVGKVAMTRFQSNFPLALDESTHRLFIGCRQPPRLVVVDTESNNEIGDTEISADTDDLFYDNKRKRVYVSCGEGFIDVMSAATNEPLQRIEKIRTRSGARTSFYSRDLDRFFLAVPSSGRDGAEIRIYLPPHL